ncbi:roadblock/LC7 domain-containing protein [Candidatus Bathyarchaeota archaeon]|nr:roadblock/LC7 domain-containing protein [Candidatus Bathyarchaeota archaeon]MCJ7714161.1 roadblock/LC7 domain-containing protein [Candidatus Bathyarchaeota archaeon]
MANKKQSIQKTEPPVIVENELSIPAIEEDSLFKSLNNNLQNLKNLKGIMGYIIRNADSATIDLKEPEKLVEYAIFTSQVMDSSKELAELFDLGDLATILIEGEELKVLIMIIKENKINIFMKKSVDHINIGTKVSP